MHILQTIRTINSYEFAIQSPRNFLLNRTFALIPDVCTTLLLIAVAFVLLSIF